MVVPEVSEQMEKYINHDLGSIIEEHSKIMKVASSNKNSTTKNCSEITPKLKSSGSEN